MYVKYPDLVSPRRQKRFLAARGEGAGRLGNGGSMSWGPFGEDGNVLDLDGGVAAPHWECTKCHWTVHFQMVPLVLYKFHLNKSEYIEKGGSLKNLPYG